jgi:hypothetical protein
LASRAARVQLDEEQLLLNAHGARWANHASRAAEVALQELRTAALLRAVKVDAVAAELGLASFPGLRALLGASPEPWRSIFARHRQAFLQLTSEVHDLSERNQHLLSQGRDAEVGQEMASMVPYQNAYDASTKFITAIDNVLRSLISIAHG